jgi:hypothetical protein
MIQLAEDLLELSNDGHEKKYVWTFIWGQTYSVSKFYQHHFKSIQPPSHLELDLKIQVCSNNNFFFAWLLLNDRLNTRNILRRRKKFLENYNYVMCQCNVEETLEHLFFDCSCAATRWFSLGIVWNDEAQVNHKIMRQDCFPLPFFHGDLHGGYLVHLE